MSRSKAPNNPDSYEAVHLRLYANRGKARDHQCIVETCPERATEWAWQHVGESRTGLDFRGRERTWGLDIATYEPMCRQHHRMIDGGGTLTHCARGHDRSVGANTHGRCRGCAREDAKAWRARQ